MCCFLLTVQGAKLAVTCYKHFKHMLQSCYNTPWLCTVVHANQLFILSPYQCPHSDTAAEGCRKRP